ncbi:MAG: hypothetical protein Q7U89_01280 [Coriobacteriia bacterium]|nr:hypothetical protein [Coriobacteriia bacterium]
MTMERPATITGDIVDIYSGQAIGGDAIIVRGLNDQGEWSIVDTAVADAYGYFMVDGLNPGSYIVSTVLGESSACRYLGPATTPENARVIELAAAEIVSVRFAVCSDVEAPRTSTSLRSSSARVGSVVRFMASDDKSGVSRTYYRLNGRVLVDGSSLILTKLGLNTIEFYSVDAAGNVEQTQKSTVYVKSVRESKLRPTKR